MTSTSIVTNLIQEDHNQAVETQEQSTIYGMITVIEEYICTEIKSMNTHNSIYSTTDGM